MNAKAHIGHAYTNIATDVLARWHRLKGEDVFFLTGTDEHGKKVETSAEKAKKDPQKFVDEISKKFKDVWKTLNISYGSFIRTTDSKHKKAVYEVLRRMQDRGDIYKGVYEGWYCTPCESYWTETQLKEDKCPSCGRSVEKLKEESYFFKLSKYQKPLLELYKNNPGFISPEHRKQEIINRVKEGLRDLSITRTSFDWGIKYPGDDKHIVYVWVDALTNYISALGFPDSNNYKKYWPADVHILGKEISWFHAVIWPAMLLSIGEKPPKKLFIHGWLTIDGKKMSKSVGNVIDPVEMSKKYSSDSLRYFLLREIPFGHDGDFSEKTLKEKINNELVADLGNLVNRTLTMTEKFKGKLEGKDELSKEFNLKKIEGFIDNYEFHHALDEIWNFIRAANRYINDKEPWKLEGKELANVLYNLLESLRIISILVSSFMPDTSIKMNKQLGVKTGSLKDCKFGKLSGKPKKGDLLFQKIKT
ncbi:MAG: methionine--tRNA ligase [Nanoarchaeota archaeon]|nr:methionine--tRNA ligase [Nanoarchaeota archaeon]MBU1134915.1 methionine--tRNA ligase [Nanoarchaeota archaeon]MBU2520258.1 methionine--tRNA ligase [Nanoarchaeota archaeon]